jgi:carbamoyl-phosphate synthase large subunit
MVGKSISELKAGGHLPLFDGVVSLPGDPISVKEAVLPFKRFATPEGNYVDSLLGPEMRSTGEVMGIDIDFPMAFAKSQAAAGSSLPKAGKIFVSVADRDKPQMLLPIRRLSQLGFEILATEGTAQILQRHGITSSPVRKHSQGTSDTLGPTIVELITAGAVDVVVNTPTGAAARRDGYEIRAATTAADKPIFTTIAQLSSAIGSFESVIAGPFKVKSLQEYAQDRNLALGK